MTHKQTTDDLPAGTTALPGSTLTVILCFGLYSSASTWAFNVAGQICRLNHPSAQVLQTYADNTDGDLVSKIRELERVVIKSHVPSATLRATAYISGVAVIITLRDPRDAVASLMSRFAVSFEQALGGVAASCSALVELTVQAKFLLLRYEDGFYKHVETVKAIATCLNVKSSERHYKDIFDSLTVGAVKATIKALEEQGVFQELAPIAALDPVTHWHPGHIGDRRVGKWVELLTAKQAADVADATRSYCAAFGYDAASQAELACK